MLIPPSFASVNSKEHAEPGPTWTQAAEERLKKVPFFVRSMVRSAVERYAVEKGCLEITPEMMENVKNEAGRMRAGGHQ